MAKKERTPTEQKKHYNRLGNLLFGSEFLAVIIPFVTIGIVNYDKYFIQYNGTKMSIACFLAIGLMGIATWLVAKNKFSNSFVTLIIGWATATIIFYLLGELITDIATIMLFGLVGILTAYGLDVGSKSLKKKASKIGEAIEQAQKEQMVEAYKQESTEKKKVKVKIVKSAKTEQKQEPNE